MFWCSDALVFWCSDNLGKVCSDVLMFWCSGTNWAPECTKHIKTPQNTRTTRWMAAYRALSSEPIKQLPDWSYMSIVDSPHLLEARVVDHGYDECQAIARHALILASRSCHCLLLPSALQAKTVICTLVSMSRPAILLSLLPSCTCKLLLPSCTDLYSAFGNPMRFRELGYSLMILSSKVLRF